MTNKKLIDIWTETNANRHRAPKALEKVWERVEAELQERMGKGDGIIFTAHAIKTASEPFEMARNLTLTLPSAHTPLAFGQEHVIPGINLPVALTQLPDGQYRVTFNHIPYDHPVKIEDISDVIYEGFCTSIASSGQAK